MNFETEKGFMQAVVDLARLQGWKVYHTYDARKSEPGFPDLTMVRGSFMFMAELKLDGRDLSPAQEEWHDALVRVDSRDFHNQGGVANKRCFRYRVWRPSDWPEIEQVLEKES